MQILILAGGRGMALRPLTDALPPPLLPVAGGTLLDHLLHHVSTLPAARVALVLQYRGDQIHRSLATRPELHLIPQEPPFTLVGALASAARWVEEPTLVLHADAYFATSLRPPLEVCNPEQATFFVSEPFRGEVALAASAYLLPPEAFLLAREQPSLPTLAALRAALAASGFHPTTQLLDGWVRHVETPADLLTVNRFLLTRWHETLRPPGSAGCYDALNFTWVASDAQVDRASHYLFSTIGPRATLRHSDLFNTLVLPDTILNEADEHHAVLASNGDHRLRLYAPKPSSMWNVG